MSTKRCPHCSEEILAVAKKCKYCLEWLEEIDIEDKTGGNNLVENISPNSLKEAIVAYIQKTPLRTKNILAKPNINNIILEKYQVKIDKGEEPLIILYKTAPFGMTSTKLLITEKKIYFKAVPDTFWTSLFLYFMKPIQGFCEIQGLESLEIAEHDTCYGNAYIGHQLKINNQVIGLVRMGAGMYYDEEAICYLNGLFDYLAENDFIKNAVKKYTWQ